MPATRQEAVRLWWLAAAANVRAGGDRQPEQFKQTHAGPGKWRASRKVKAFLIEGAAESTRQLLQPGRLRCLMQAPAPASAPGIGFVNE